jgi:PLP dependent protein
MSIADNISSIKNSIPSNVTLVAVSKFKSNDDILEAYAACQRVFGENYVQELIDKQASLPQDIEWHFIGHLQRNKVKFIAPFVHTIHGVDSLRLLEEINKQGKALGKVINCLLQMHIAAEDTKEGLNETELLEVLDNLDKFENITINGLMGMASFTDDQKQLTQEFVKLKNSFEDLKTKKLSNLQMKTLSMGMSGDFKLAIENGSTMIRVGTLIFGSRK